MEATYDHAAGRLSRYKNRKTKGGDRPPRHYGKHKRQPQTISSFRQLLGRFSYVMIVALLSAFSRGNFSFLLHDRTTDGEAVRTGRDERLSAFYSTPFCWQPERALHCMWKRGRGTRGARRRVLDDCCWRFGAAGSQLSWLDGTMGLMDFGIRGT